MCRITFASGLLALVLAACHAEAPVRQPEPETSTTTTTSALTAVDPGTTEDCALVCGPIPDHHAKAVADADDVFTAMHDDLLACYKKRVQEDPRAHAFLYVDVVIDPDGAVRSVETSGGANMGDRAMHCITSRIQRARFTPVEGGGTRHVQVPLSFSRTLPGED